MYLQSDRCYPYTTSSSVTTNRETEQKEPTVTNDDCRTHVFRSKQAFKTDIQTVSFICVNREKPE